MTIKDQLKAALTGIHERPINYPHWGFTGAMLREFTARERRYANDAVIAQDGENPDQILYQAMLLQRCITDPETGSPYIDGRSAIDPRTRTPIFSIEEVEEIADSRSSLFNQLWDDLMELSALGPQAMFSGNPEADRPKRDEGEGIKRTANPIGETPPQGLSDTDSGSPLVDGGGEGDGAIIEQDAG